MASYKFSESFLNNSFIRFIIGLFIVMFILYVLSSDYYLLSWLIVPAILVGIIIFSISFSKVMQHVEFFEWDYTERKKKARFIQKYIFLNSFFSVMFSFGLAFLATSIFLMENVKPIEYFLFSAPCVVFLLNIFKTVSLWYPLFENDLTIEYKIQKKPQNWIDSGKEIKPEDEAREILERDFGIQ